MDSRIESPQDQARFVQAALQHDEAAWEALVRAHQEPVFRFAYLILGDSAEAQDAAQETFIRAYRTLERFDPSRPMRPWLLSITANLSRNRLRSLGRYLSALRRFGSRDPAPAAQVESLSLAQIEAQSLWQAVRQLDPNDQQVIYLRYFLDLPVEETALAIQAAEGTVKSRLHRALQRLRAIIERDYPGLREGWPS